MLDTQTGQFIPLTPEQVDSEEKRRAEFLQAEIERLRNQPVQAGVKPKAVRGNRPWEIGLPLPEHRGPIFAVGEIVELKGAKFKVQQFTGSRIILKAIPHQFADK